MSKPHALAGGTVPIVEEVSHTTIVCDDATYTLSGGLRTKFDERVNAAGDTIITVVLIPSRMVAEDGEGGTFRVVGVAHARTAFNEDTGPGQVSITVLLRIVGRGGGIVGTVWTEMRTDADGVMEFSDRGTCELRVTNDPLGCLQCTIDNCISFEPEGCPPF